MGRYKKTTLAVLIGVIAATSIATTASAALPIVLNAAKTLVTTETASSSSAEGKVTTLSVLESKEIECKTNKSTGELKQEKIGTEPAYLGPVHATFEECKLKGAGGENCTGEGDTAGTILGLGEAHLVYDSLAPLAGALLVLFPTAIKYTCKQSGINVTFAITGSALCLVKPVNVLAKHFEGVCEQSAPGDPKEVKYWNAKGEEKTAELLTSVSGGANKMTAESGVGLVLTPKEVELMV